MNIRDVLLFVSTVDPDSIPCTTFVSKNKIPLKVVRLDTEESREQARNGKQFQITVVPTLVIIFSDGTFQFFIKSQKIISKLIELLTAPQRQSPPPQSQPHTKKPTVVESSGEDEGSEEEQSEELEPVKKAPPKKQLKKKPAAKKPRKKIIVEDDETIPQADSGQQSPDIVFIDDGKRPSRPPPLPTDNLRVGIKSSGKRSNKSLIAMAKQMEKEREAALGYREEDLPVNL